MGITILYAIFKTGKNIGKLTHLAYVSAQSPHEALNLYLHEEGAQNPTSLIALACSGNKFTMYNKSESNSPRRIDNNERLKKMYKKVDWYDMKIPCNHKPRYVQLRERWHNVPSRNKQYIQRYL